MNKRDIEFRAGLKRLNNRALWEQYKESQIPDGYDGEFTNIGAEELTACEEEIELRLAEWLKQ